jgi:hypothetical protein
VRHQRIKSAASTASTSRRPLVIGRSSAAATLTAAVGVAVLVLGLVVAVIALGAAFGCDVERQRACLQTLQTLLRLAPRTGRR